MSGSFLLGGYVGVTPSRRPDWMVGAIPDPFLTISNCLAGDLLVPQFYGWFQDVGEALAASNDASRSIPLVAVGLAAADAENLLNEYADQPYYFALLRERLPLPLAARVLGFEIVGIEYGLSFHSWRCHSYADEVERELEVTTNFLGLIDTYADARLVLDWMLARPSDQAPEPVPWTVVMLAELAQKSLGAR